MKLSPEGVEESESMALPAKVRAWEPNSRGRERGNQEETRNGEKDAGASEKGPKQNINECCVQSKSMFFNNIRRKPDGEQRAVLF
jgi:hypothetical protein